MATRTITTPAGVSLAITELPGPGDRLLFVHGWRCRRADWNAVLPGLAGDDITTLDLPMHGDSPDVGLPRALAGYGEVLADAIGVLGLDDVTLIGHSMGAAVSVEATILVPERVRRIVAVDALTYDFVYPRQSPEAIDATMTALRADFDSGMLALVEALFPVRNEALIHQIATEMADADPDRSNDLLVGLLEWDMAARAPLVHCPIDVIASHALLSDASRAAVPAGARLTEVDLGGHFFLREQPAGTAAVLREVLARS